MKVRMLYVIVGLTISLVMLPLFAQAQSSQDAVTGKEIIDKLTQMEIRLTRVEEGQKALEKRIDDMRDDINNMRDGMNRRIDDLRSEIKGDIEELRGLVYLTLGGIIALIGGIVALIGFVIWDRRTAITPVVKRTKELEEERDTVWKVLKEYAKREPRFAEVMRTAGLL
ncbi:MAG: hypothetical protein QME81_12200 [bacterium]|nr:hypothetical protein [bacterium]